MNRFKYLVLIFIVGILGSCVQEHDLAGGTNSEAVVDEAGILKGWVRIKLKEDAQPLRVGAFTRGEVQSGDPELDRIAQALGATEIERVFNEGGRFAERRRKFGLHLWYDIRIDETIPVSRATSDLGILPEIAYAQPIYEAKLLDDNGLPAGVGYVPQQLAQPRPLPAPFNDPDLSLQWHYNNDGTMQNSIEGADINLYEAWKTTAGDPRVIVAVMDSGVQFDHPDLVDNMWVNEAEKNGIAGVDDDNNGYVDDFYGWNAVRNSGEIYPQSHGTHVAGTIAAVNNNGIGVCGIAGGTGKNDGVKVMSLQLTEMGQFSKQCADAYIYAADNGAVISQNSWGYTNSGMPQDVADALGYFIANAGIDENGNQVGPMKGGVLIFACGNSNLAGIPPPASDLRTIAVAAMGPDYRKPQYSNYSNLVDIFSPGGADTQNEPKYKKFNEVYSTTVDDGYTYMYGTSMACPHVSGVAALIVSHFGAGKQGFTADDLKKRLLRSYRSVDDYVEAKYLGKLGVGLVDAGMLFLEDSGRAPGKITDEKVTAAANNFKFSWVVSADGNDLPPAQFKVSYTGVGVGIFEGKVPDIADEFVLLNYTSPGNRASYEWMGKYNTAYTFTVRAVDRFGHESEGQTFTHTTADFVNQRPKVATRFEPIAIENTGEEYQVELDLSTYFADPNGPDGDILTYTLSNLNDNVVRATVKEGSKLLLLPRSKGTCNLGVTATDLHGEFAYSTAIITVQNGSDKPINPGGTMTLSPNPADDVLSIHLSTLNSTSVQVTVFDAGARKMINQRVDVNAAGAATLDVKRLSSGLYSVVLNHADGKLKGNFIKR